MSSSQQYVSYHVQGCFRIKSHNTCRCRLLVPPELYPSTRKLLDLELEWGDLNSSAEPGSKQTLASKACTGERYELKQDDMEELLIVSLMDPKW